LLVIFYELTPNASLQIGKEVVPIFTMGELILADLILGFAKSCVIAAPNFLRRPFVLRCTTARHMLYDGT
jgi:hypothetical protein